MTDNEISSVPSSSASAMHSASPTFHSDFWQNLGAVDIVLLIILAASVIIGLFRGFSRETRSLIIWGGVLWITACFNPYLIDKVGQTVVPEVRNSPLFIWGGRVLLFMVTLAVLNIIAQQIVKWTQNTLSEGIDHVLGGLFGGARGYIVLIIVFMLVGWAAPNWLENLTNKSVVIPYVEQGAHFIQDNLPSSLQEDLAFETTNSH